ncbi:methyltransferase domain-containing protein [Agrobacterium vitis]|uniref:methyltransferase domain-containing protein n=1 Tax=Agrobacterium vitis TaxID=373 RepID=UPI0012E752C5|nr:methyltransferase domain-containing protein [Agrobacterium vitis]MUZ63457.1 hypothetical protein [Agrobacterium vitis]
MNLSRLFKMGLTVDAAEAPEAVAVVDTVVEPPPLLTRSDITAAAKSERLVMEIGPFNSPVAIGENARYCDIMTTDELRQRAIKIGIDPNTVPAIHYHREPGILENFPEKFSAVVSCHCIEHQPDLIHHFQQVAATLEDDGRYYLIVPDKRYCFDHSIPVSTSDDIVMAKGATRHPLIKVIEHRAITTHNNPIRHWNGDHFDNDWHETQPKRALAAIAEYQAADGGYVDVHRWQFTPNSLGQIINELQTEIPFSVEQINETPRGIFEFVAVLKKS